MARRRFKRAGFNTKLIMDVGLAGIATRILPAVVNKFMPLDPTLYSVVGAGGTYLVGSMLKKPDLANAGIALGLVELVAPMVENLIGGIVPTSLPSAAPTPPMIGQTKLVTKKSVALDDFITLNDGTYVPYPSARSSREYASGY